MEEKISIMDLVSRYGQPMTQTLEVLRLKQLLWEGIIVIVVSENEGGSETIIGLRNAKEDVPTYYKHFELWKKGFYRVFELFFIPRERQQDFVCDFVRLKGRLVKVHSSPLYYKGLSWGKDDYWVIILNGKSAPAAQGELFPEVNKQLEINVGSSKAYHLFLQAFNQKKFKRFDVYRLSSLDWTQFFSIHDWYSQREISRELDNEFKLPIAESETA